MRMEYIGGEYVVIAGMKKLLVKDLSCMGRQNPVVVYSERLGLLVKS
jgi:hypothetical protein